MTLQPGARLGPYEIVSAIGAGGMGEVYKARDTRLDRTVALKVIGAAFAGTPEWRERFEREARAISQLNHPAICTLHDVGRADDTSYIVLEHLEGEPLSTRIARAPMAPQEALPIAIAVCEALDAAHRQGIVHRDLKPGNIMLVKRGTPKLLDFGLAKLSQTAVVAGALDAATASTTPLTARGTMLGTFQYMSPEQLEGADADARSDIWAFGCVLYEMLTGHRAFEGKTQASLISAILASEPPPLSTLQPVAPPALDYTVRTCLAKSPEDRFQNAHDLLLQLRWVASAGSQAGVPAAVVAGRKRRDSARMLGAILASVLPTAAIVYWTVRPPDVTPAPVIKASITLPGALTYVPSVTTNLAISPDGRYVAFAGLTNELTQLYLRDNRTGEVKMLPGTEVAIMPFFSPDGSWLGFMSAGNLKKIPVSGGTPSAICDHAAPFGAVWMPDGTIVFASSTAGPLMAVGTQGGTPTPVTALAAGETSHRWPSLLPDGKTLIYAAGTGGAWGDAHIVAQRFGETARTIVHRGGTAPRYASGHLVYARGATLHAVPFDTKRLVTTGTARSVADGLLFTDSDGRSQYALTADGTLISVHAMGVTPKRTLVWVTRDGKVNPLPAPPRAFEHPRLSPDGRYVAVAIRGEGDPDIWVYDLQRATLSRFTFAAGEDESPVWTPDSRFITFSSSRSGNLRQTFLRPVDGSSPEEELFSSSRHQHLGSWSPDGRTLISEEVDGSWTIYASVRGQQGKPVETTPFLEQGVQISPDGRWIAYSSNESGPTQVYVQAFPGPGGKFQVSTDGGAEPQWSRVGNELFFRHGDQVMVVAVQTKPTFSFGPPAVLFKGKFSRMGWPQANYDVARDGKRLLMVHGEDESLPREFSIITNWLRDLNAPVLTR